MLRSSVLSLTLMAVLVGSLVFSISDVVADDDGSVRDEPIARILAAARKIDSLVAADLSRNKIRANPLTNDATFMRRVYLSIIGRIPTAEEARAFLASKKSDRRTRLIDQLLDSPGYSSHMFNYWADIFRVKNRLGNQTSGEPYIQFLKESIATNKPYDVFVSELIAAEGPAYARGNGATGYYLRDRGMPEDNMGNTVRIFLGTRVECAQCHDHPFDKWTQKQFHEMVAFTGGIQYRSQSFDFREANKARQAGKEIRKEKGERAYQNFRRQVLLPMQQGVQGNGTGLSRLPDDYQYDNAAPEQWIKAKTMFGEEVSLEPRIPRENPRLRRQAKKNPRFRSRLLAQAPQIQSRAAFAEWLTSPLNPRFTVVIANRMWKKAMGLGLIEPVDSMTDTTKPVNQAAMSYMEQLVVDLGYDLKQVLRVLYNTKTWQREASRTAPSPNEPYHFPGPLLQRMSAEQMWDSLLTLVVPNIDQTLSDPKNQRRAEAVYASYERMANKSLDELIAIYSGDGTDQMMDAGDRLREAARKMRQTQTKAQPILRELRRARRRNDKGAEKRLTARLKAIGYDERASSRRNRGSGQLSRASDQRMPAPAGHFLRQFGQSDRDQIQLSNATANVPQVLSLLNGFVEQNILASRRSGVLMYALQKASTTTDVIRAAYMSILGRSPKSSEVAMWKASILKEGRSEGTKDMVWTLVNTHEFRFVQ